MKQGPKRGGTRLKPPGRRFVPRRPPAVPGRLRARLWLLRRHVTAWGLLGW